jgi:hypothetical protein
MAVSFKKIDIEKEHELEQLIIKNPDEVEEGLIFLTHQQQVSGGFIDVLCVDKDGIFVIIELKISDDDGIILQGLHYYDYVMLNKAAIANQFSSKAKFNLDEEPRIILIAPYFSERVKKASKYVTPQLRLMEFVHLKTSKGEKGLFFKELKIDTEEEYSPPKPIERIVEYIHFPKTRGLCNDIVKTITNECKELDEPKTAGNTGIRFRFKNRKIADIWVKRSFFWIGCFQDPHDWFRIKTKNDWIKHKKRFMTHIHKLYEHLGGQ